MNYDILKDFSNKVILSTHNYLYLDCGLGNMFGGMAWCEPFKTWRHIYNFDPYEPKIDRNRILGAVAALWGELTNEHEVMTKMWPRASALAERLWNTNEKKSHK